MRDLNRAIDRYFSSYFCNNMNLSMIGVCTCRSYTFLAATKQLYEHFSPSVRPSVHPSQLFHNVPVIVSSWNFIGVIIIDKNDVHAKGKGQRSNIKVTEVKTIFSRFRTVTSFWIHIWQWNYAQSLILLMRGALLVFKVIRQISRSHGYKIRRFWPKLCVSGCNSSLNSPIAIK